MSISVNTNYGALLALQNLNATSSQLDEVQSRINTTLKVSGAKDDGAVFAIAESLRSRVSSLGSVKDGLSFASDAVNTAISAGEQIGDLLKQMKTKATDAQKAGLTASDKEALQTSFNLLREQINSIANAADYNGTNLANGNNTATSSAGRITVLTSDLSTSDGTAGKPFIAEGAALTGAKGTTQLVGLTVSGATIDDGDKLTFTTGSGANTHVYNVAIAAGDTISSFFDKVNTATDGAVTGSIDSDGRITWRSAESFSVDATETTDTSTAKRAFLGETSLGAAQTAADSTATVNTAANGNEFLADDGTEYTVVTRTVTVGGSTTTEKWALDSRDIAQFDNAATVTLADGSDYYIFEDDNGTHSVEKGAGVTNLATAVTAWEAVTGGTASNAVAWTPAAGDTVDINGTTFEVGEGDGTANLEFLHFTGTNSGRFTDSDQSVTIGSDRYWLVDPNGAATRDLDGTVSGTGLLAYKSSAGTSTEALAAYNASVASGSASSSSTTVDGYDWKIGATGGALETITSSLDVTTDASGAASAIDTALSALNKNLATLGARSQAFKAQSTFLQKLSDTLEKGIGTLVDADLAKESARLQSLQTKQQLGAQALSIANQAPSLVLSLFR